MKFFIPKIDSPEKAEILFNSIKKFAEDTLKWEVNDRRIRKIVCNHKGKSETYEVGQIAPDTGELVVAILASNSYLVCTPNRGFLRGMPLLVGYGEALEVEDFET